MSVPQPNVTQGFIGPLVILMTLAMNAAYAESPALPDPLKAGWKGKAVCEHLFEDAVNRILRCTFPPGTGHERHYYVPHFGYAISGGRVQITSESGVRRLELTTGSHYNSPGTLWHEVKNIGDTTITYLIVENTGELHALLPAD